MKYTRLVEKTFFCYNIVLCVFYLFSQYVEIIEWNLKCMIDLYDKEYSTKYVHNLASIKK